jgi:hypothetical protein
MTASPLDGVLFCDRYTPYNFGQNAFRRLAIGVGVEVQDDSMTQDGRRDFLYVIYAQLKAAAHQCKHPAALH